MPSDSPPSKESGPALHDDEHQKTNILMNYTKDVHGPSRTTPQNTTQSKSSSSHSRSRSPSYSPQRRSQRSRTNASSHRDSETNDEEENSTELDHFNTARSRFKSDHPYDHEDRYDVHLYDQDRQSRRREEEEYGYEKKYSQHDRQFYSSPSPRYHSNRVTISSSESDMNLEKGKNQFERGSKEILTSSSHFWTEPTGRAGGVYMPPYKKKMLNIDTPTSNLSLESSLGKVDINQNQGYQKQQWELLRKTINGLINKVSAFNITNIVLALFKLNIIRGRGLLCKCLMTSQMASPIFTPVYACLVAVVNTKFPEIGELLLIRLICQFKKGYRRQDKHLLLCTTRFIAHLANQFVCGLFLPLQILLLLLDKPSEGSIEIAASFMQEIGQRLGDASPRSCADIFDHFRAILNQGQVDKRVEYLIENLFSVRKSKFKDYPSIPAELDLVEEQDQIGHENLSIEEDSVTPIDPQEEINVFEMDPKWVENEEKYKQIKLEILGEEVDSEESNSEEEDDDEVEKSKVVIQDATSVEIANLKRAVYLTIMSSRDHEEVAHKLLKMGILPGQEYTVCNMFLQCCAEERTYLKFYGLIGQRFSVLEVRFQSTFETLFEETYKTIHRLSNERQRLLNTSHFFSHLLFTDALPWRVLQHIKLTEKDTTSSSRIFVKIVFTDLAEFLGIKKLNERLQDTKMREAYFQGLFPTESPPDIKFAINFWTAINLGALTDQLRVIYSEIIKMITNRRAEEVEMRSSNPGSRGHDSGSDSESYDSSGSYSSDGSSSSGSYSS